MTRALIPLLVLTLTAGLSAPLPAADLERHAPFVLIPVFDGTVLAFEPETVPKGLRNVMLSVSGPRNYAASLATKSDLPKFDLREGGKLFDGHYRFEVTGATAETLEINTPIDDNGRDAEARNKIAVPVQFAGSFAIRDGKIVRFAPEKEDEQENTE